MKTMIAAASQPPTQPADGSPNLPVLSGIMNHVAVLARPVVQRCRVRLGEAFQRHVEVERHPDQLVRYPEHGRNWSVD